MGAYVYPLTLLFGCVSFVACSLIFGVDMSRRFRKRRRMEKYIRSLEFQIYRREVTSGGELRSLSGLIVEMGDEDLGYLEHRDRVWRLLVFATERCNLLSSSERGYASHCADWLCDQLSERDVEHLYRRTLVETIEALYGLANRLDDKTRSRIAAPRSSFEGCGW